MEIYTVDRKKELDTFLEEDIHRGGKRRRVLAAPALGVLPEKLVREILERNHLSEREKKIIFEYWKKEKYRLEEILSHSTVADEIAEITEEEYEKYPVVLSLAECFLEKDIKLTYGEYLEGIKAAEEYAGENDNYMFQTTKVKGFHNIQITCFEEKWCKVSKNRAPAIHFVIHHPKLRYALENMILPIRDQEKGGDYET